MSTLTGRTVMPSGEPPLDARLCADVGAQLTRVRVSRGLTEAQVGERLLLSTRQVKALEAVDLGAFHNATFYVKALRKYGRFADVDPALITRVAESMVRDATPLADIAASGAADRMGRWRRAAVSAAALLTIGALIAGGSSLVRARRANPRSSVALPPVPAPVASADINVAPPAQVDTHAPAPTAPEAPATPAAPDEASSSRSSTIFGSLRVQRATWIFLRDGDNVVIERSLAAGESIDLETQPTYLAVGLPDAELTIGAQPVDLSPFVSNGQIRLRAGDFDALVQGASPIQAPTAVKRQ